MVELSILLFVFVVFVAGDVFFFLESTFFLYVC